MRAPPDDALEFAFVAAQVHATERAHGDERAAASTALAIAAEDIGGLPGASHPRGYAHRGGAVDPHDAPRDIEDAVGIDLGHRCGRVHPRKETGLGAVFIADPRDDLLV